MHFNSKSFTTDTVYGLPPRPYYIFSMNTLDLFFIVIIYKQEFLFKNIIYIIDSDRIEEYVLTLECCFFIYYFVVTTLLRRKKRLVDTFYHFLDSLIERNGNPLPTTLKKKKSIKENLFKCGVFNRTLWWPKLND